ncbi:MAG TPA: ATP-binding protein [Kiritimatiellia bacterium]|nr:ATP-binding protein [Kiritimatiellia bacterium]
MSWIDFSWTAAIAATITLALLHLLISVRLAGRMRGANFFFFLSAIAVAITGYVELVVMRAQTLEHYQAAMFYAEFSIWLMFVSLAGFTWYFFEKGRAWMPLAVVVIGTVCLLANIVVPPEMRIRHAVEIRPTETFAGATFTWARLKNGPVTVIEIMTVILLLAFVIDSAARAWQRGKKRQAVLVGGGIVFFLSVTRFYAVLVEQEVIQTPYFFIFPFLALLLAMGSELSKGVLEGARLAVELKEHERQIDLAARAAILGFWRWDLKQNTLWATPGARAIFGFTADEPLSFSRFEEQVHPNDLAVVKKRIAGSITSDGDYEAEYRIHKDGEGWRWIGARGRIERTESGEPLLMRGVVIDITEKKKAQADIDDMRKELAHVTRASILGELAGSLAHEINQPLTAVLSNAQAARRMLAGPQPDMDEIREILDDIIKDDKRAGEVIHRLRAMVQKQADVVAERIVVNELVSDLVHFLNSEFIARNVRTSLQLAPELVPVMAGRVEIQQVLLNLIVNGMDAMQDRPAQERKLTISTEARPGSVCIHVRDVGTGISESIMPSIFSPFFTTKASGLGMGLAVSRNLVEAYGGKLSAANHPQGGAVFTVTLPVDVVA